MGGGGGGGACCDNMGFAALTEVCALGVPSSFLFYLRISTNMVLYLGRPG